MNPLQCFRAALCLVLLLCLQVRSQNYLSLEPEIRSGTDQDGRRAVDLKIRAFDALGSPATSGPTTLTLRAYSLASGGMVISEVSSDGAEIEFTNTGASDVDLSGWMLRVGSQTDFQSNSEARRITGNGRLKPGGLLLWSSRTNASDQFPNLRRFRSLSPFYVNLIELRDPSGQLVDEVRFYDAPPAAGRLWTGAPVASLGVFSNSIQRRGTRNHFAATDWIIATPSIGRINPDLILPSGGPILPLTLDPQTATLTNGTWSGTVRLAANGVRSVRFEASVQDGLFFASQPVPLSPLPPLQLNVVSGSTRGSEATAGNLAEVEIRLPAPNSSGVPITPKLQFDVPGEFEVSKVGSIAPGEQRTVVQLRNLDDDVADGTAVVTLTALVPGFEPATLTLLNDDDEFAALHLSVPDQASEGAGLLPLRGLVSLPNRASHPTRVDLDFDGRVTGPEFVIVPAGAASAEIPVFIVDDGYENIAPLHDTITATTSDWLPVTSQISVRDDEYFSLSLSVPNRIVEGIPTNGIVTLRFPRDRPTTLLTRASDSRLGIPATVEIPAGVSSVSIPIPATDDHASVGSRYVNVCVAFSFASDFSWCQGVQFAEKDPATVTLQPTLDSPLWSGTPIPFTLVANDGFGVRPAVSGPVQMRISSGIGPAAIDPAYQTVTLTDGSYTGAIQINGFGQQLTLEMVFRGQTNTLTLPPVEAGRRGTNGFQFLAARPGHTTLLALRASPFGSSDSGRFSEVDPASGLVLREVSLPFSCTQFAVADSGSVAWAAGYTDRLVRIDLEQWTNSISAPLLGTNSHYYVFGLAISKGASDELAVGLDTAYAAPPLVFGVRDGKPLPSTVSVRPKLP